MAQERPYRILIPKHYWESRRKKGVGPTQVGGRREEIIDARRSIAWSMAGYAPGNGLREWDSPAHPYRSPQPCPRVAQQSGPNRRHRIDRTRPPYPGHSDKQAGDRKQHHHRQESVAILRRHGNNPTPAQTGAHARRAAFCRRRHAAGFVRQSRPRAARCCAWPDAAY